jgi:hypothetical protein
MTEYNTLTREECAQWFTLWLQVKNGYHMEPSDTQELFRLNFLVMEVAHHLHNGHMMEGKQ